ncbi:hypothetical protein SPLC1_S102880 [Arthrospira platensis C1]|nr:hypothetical protein SPLC1_S102880 [Arthrospira platensis C1]
MGWNFGSALLLRCFGKDTDYIIISQVQGFVKKKYHFFLIIQALTLSLKKIIMAVMGKGDRLYHLIWMKYI